MKILSLFSNVGFGEFYLNDLDHEVVVANDILPDRVEFYKALHPDTKEVVCGDICLQSTRSKIVKACEKHGPIDIIIATPPCQGMSIANAQKESDDVRNRLIVHAMNIFNKVQPKYMLIENVPQMAKTYINYRKKAINIVDFIRSKLPKGFDCRWDILNGKHYGTAQSRSRSICLISKGGKWSHPEPNKETLSVRDAIGHLPSLTNGEHSDIPWHFSPKHNDNHVEWMSSTPEGDTAFNNPIHYPQKDGRRIKGFMTTYKRMRWDEPAPTVTMTNGSISSQNNVHPSDPRVLSIKELLLICGLPKNCLDKFSNKLPDDTFSYDYSPNFMRKVIGEIFLPNMCLEILRTINYE
jgi:DNA (cytosine-5)-methyltransferase 1